MVGIILIILFQNTLEKQFHFKAKFQFDWLSDQVEHVPTGVGALISWKHTLFEQQENKELICESVVRPWRAKARPRELWSSGVSTSTLYRNQETLSKESIRPFKKAKFKLAISKFSFRSDSGIKLPLDGSDWQGRTLWGHLYVDKWHVFSQWDWVIVSLSSITALNPHKVKWPLSCTCSTDSLT